jgi:RNA polymerase sigma-70 factor, ECF subfamily
MRRALVFAKAPTGVKPGGKIMASARSAFAGRGGQAGLLCVPKAARPTAAVQMLFWWLLPHHSPSQQVMFAGRFHRGNRAWSAAHQRTRRDHPDVPRRAPRLTMRGAWAVKRQPDMRRPGARGMPGASLAAGAEQPDGRFASTGREAAGELFTACYPRLAGWVRRLVDTDEDAHDIAAEAFARLLGRWSRVDNPHGYLYMIAANLASDHWRKIGREQRALSKLTGAAAGTSYHQAQEVDVRALIEALPPRLRDAFLLHHYAGIEVRRIATMMGRPEGTIKADLHHARMRLKAALADTAGDLAPRR